MFLVYFLFLVRSSFWVFVYFCSIFVHLFVRWFIVLLFFMIKCKNETRRDDYILVCVFFVAYTGDWEKQILLYLYQQKDIVHFYHSYWVFFFNIFFFHEFWQRRKLICHVCRIMNVRNSCSEISREKQLALYHVEFNSSKIELLWTMNANL